LRFPICLLLHLLFEHSNIRILGSSPFFSILNVNYFVEILWESFLCRLLTIYLILVFLLRNLLAVMVVVPAVLIHMYKTRKSHLNLSKSSFKYNQNKLSLSACLITHHNVKIIVDISVV